eukprot:1180116-Prorocentrum_minimum.AAC.4
MLRLPQDVYLTPRHQHRVGGSSFSHQPLHHNSKHTFKPNVAGKLFAAAQVSACMAIPDSMRCNSDRRAACDTFRTRPDPAHPAECRSLAPGPLGTSPSPPSRLTPRTCPCPASKARCRRRTCPFRGSSACRRCCYAYPGPLGCPPRAAPASAAFAPAPAPPTPSGSPPRACGLRP